MTKRTVYIYVLINPKNNELFYVGATYDVEKRLKQHMADAAYYSRKHLKKYLDILNCTPIIETVDKIIVNKKGESLELEIYWIEQFRQWGFALTNNRYNLSKPKISNKLSNIKNEHTQFLSRYKLSDIEKAMK